MSDTSSRTLAEKVVDHIQLTDTALEKAAKAETEAAEKQAAVEALIPSVVDVMVQHERILPTQKEKLAEMLRDPVKTLELLAKTAEHRNADEVAKIGQGMPNEKTASYNSLSNPHVGAKTTQLAESERRLFAGLGLAPPTA